MPMEKMTKPSKISARGDGAPAGAPRRGADLRPRGYSLTSQVGFVLRKAHQRHVNIFTTHMPEDLTPMQFAVLAKLSETGPCSQNSLGRQTAMDVATVKGVVARLAERGLVHKLASREDRRKLLIDLTGGGRRTVQRVIPEAIEISAMTLAPLTRDEQAMFMRLLAKLS